MLRIEAVKRSNSSGDNVIITTVLLNGPKFHSNGCTVYLLHITSVIDLCYRAPNRHLTVCTARRQNCFTRMVS